MQILTVGYSIYQCSICNLKNVNLNLKSDYVNYLRIIEAKLKINKKVLH